MAQKAISRLEAKLFDERPVRVIWAWTCFNWDKDLHRSKKERSGFVWTRVWVVFQLVGLLLSLWSERERV